MKSKKAIVIGAGIAGLATAVRLSVKGYDVHVFEKNNYPGGKMAFFRLDGYNFDEGPSLFTQPSNIEALFDFAKKDVRDYLSYKKLDEACRYFFDNGKSLCAYTDRVCFAKEMERVVGEPAENVLNYLKTAERNYNNTGEIFLDNSLHIKKTWLQPKTAKALLATSPDLLLKSVNSFNKNFFQTQEAVQLFNRFTTYNGSNPYKAPAMLSMIPHLEHNEGTFYPMGGMVSIPNAIYRLALDLGVNFYFSTNVDKIIYEKNRVKGVRTSIGDFLSDVIVSNMDVYYTYLKLLDNPIAANKVLRQERSSSAVIFYWGIRRGFDQLGLHNIFFSKDYKSEFEDIFVNKKISHDPTVYINITSKIEAEHAPIECENWFVMVNAPYHTVQNWEEMKKEVRNIIIKKLNVHLATNIEDYIEAEHTLDPTLIESKTLSYTGSLYGTSSNSIWSAFLRHPNFNDKIKGLYFAGGSVHPGGGIPLCLKSAAITANLITS